MSTLVTTPDVVKLDLACGQRCMPGFEGVDLAKCEGVKHVVNLWKFPWPWEDSSVDEIFSSHHVEHIPMLWWGRQSRSWDAEKGEFVDHCGHKIVPDDEHDRDLFMRFFDECHRILKPGGKMTVQVPNARSDRGFQDPTHRRFIVPASFLYLDANWCKSNGLDHYTGSCDFEVKVDPITAIEEEARHAEVQAYRFQHLWNIVADWKATLLARKKGQQPLPSPIVGGAPFIITRVEETPK